MNARPAIQPRHAASPDSGRLVIYGIAFAGLMATLFGTAGLIGLLCTDTVFRSHHLVGASAARDQITYYLAMLIVGVPLWLWFWRVAQRRTERHADERDAIERALFFALVFGITATVCLFAAHTLLGVLFTLPALHDAGTSVQDGVGALLRLVVYGAAGIAYTRVGWRERPLRTTDGPRDLALQATSGLSLVFLAIGLVNGVGTSLSQLINGHQRLLLGSTPDSAVTLWSAIAAWLVSGGVAWALVTRAESAFPGVREFRVPYVYGVLGVCVPLSLLLAANMLYEILRRALGYHPDSMWTFVTDSGPVLLTAGVLWAYHSAMLWRQTHLDPAHRTGEVIFWPRRPYFAGLSFLGLLLAATGTTALLWTLLDTAIQRQTVTSSWRDGVALGIALLVPGSLAWLRPWAVLQSSAAASERERAADSRRVLLGAVVLGAGIIGAGFAVAGLWLVLRTVLGGPHDAGTISNTTRYLGTAMIAAAVAAYHATILRTDLRSGGGRASRIRLTALVAPNRRDQVAALSRELARPIRVAGYLAASEPQQDIDLEEVAERITEMAGAGVPRALIVIHAGHAQIFPYSTNLGVALRLAAPAEKATARVLG